MARKKTKKEEALELDIDDLPHSLDLESITDPLDDLAADEATKDSEDASGDDEHEHEHEHEYDDDSFSFGEKTSADHKSTYSDAAKEDGKSHSAKSSDDKSHDDVESIIPASDPTHVARHAGPDGGATASRIHTGRDDDIVIATDESEIIRTRKGADTVDAGAGDDLVVSGHGDDVIDGGSGDDVLNGGKGNDTLVYTLAENINGHDRYDGGKGNDTLELRLSVDEFNNLREELVELSQWMEDHTNVKASSGVKFKDSSSHGAEKHAVFETSFGLDVRYMENLKVVVDGHGEVPLDADIEIIIDDPVIEPEVDPEITPELITIDTAETVVGDVPVSMVLKSGSTTTVSINVDVKDVPPIYDIFMMQDLSSSFGDDIVNVKALLPSLIESLSATNDVAFGIGSFVDKPYEVFGHADYGDYAYKTDQAISTDFDLVQASMDSLNTYWGYDAPESQLEALVQSALRGDEIGFRDGAQKYVVLSTDAVFHQAGDFASAVENNYDTVLEMEDYPEIAMTGELLKAAGITPIFAVTLSVMPTYQALVDGWGFGSVVELASDSANIIEAITIGIESTSIDLTLDIAGDDYGYVTAMTPEVYPDAGPGTYTFDITLEIPEDTTDIGSDGLSVSIPGYGTIALDIEIAGMDLTGDENANTLIGDDGNNIIDGMGGDDVLSGGAGDDTFVFSDGSGKDTVTDFTKGDTLDLRRMAAVVTAADVIAAASQVGADTVINFGTGDTLTLESVDAASLSADDFLL